MPVVAHRFRKYDPEQALKLIADHNVRNSFMPPTALKMMRQVPNPSRFKLNMRSIASGGEALGAETLEWGREVFGLVINEFWGQTEANEATRLVDICLEAGLNFFDTADIYSNGVSEEVLGAAITADIASAWDEVAVTV